MCIANYFAPCGSKEWLLNYFGVQGTDFNLNSDGSPSMTDQGRSQLTAAMDLDPTLGLYSPTATMQGPLAHDTLMAGVSDIIQARWPMSDLDSLVNDWRNSVGDKMRGEFQDAMAAAKA